MHYARQRRNGDPLVTLTRRGAVCSIPGCDERHGGKGFCRNHLGRFDRHGDPLAGRPSPRTGCAVPGCEEVHNAHGLCQHHCYVRRRAPCEMKGAKLAPFDHPGSESAVG